MADDLSPDDDARLAALYRDADTDAEPPAEWSSLRAMIDAARESGFDEEPAPRIDALLMAAARAHAPAPKAAWWQRLAAWLRPVVLHPATAGALVLVVVVGAAGVMYRRGEHGPAQPPPPAATGSAAPTPVAPIAPPAVAPLVEERAVPANGEVAVAPSVPDPAPPPPGRKPAVEKPGAGAVASGHGARLDVPDVADKGGADDALGGGAAGAGSGMMPQAVAPLPPPPPERQRPADDAGEAQPDAPVTEKVPTQKPPSVESAPSAATPTELFRRALAAARAGDCVAVRALSAQVLARAPAYHRDVFAKDRTIAPCLPAITAGE